MNDLDLHLEQEAPEIEVLPDTQSAGSSAGCVSTAGSFSCPAGSIGSVGSASSAG
ncbi:MULTISPECIES: thiocillin family RiPP [Streptomyces]|uniref:Thiocillin family RiPP n=1 Tax=Streptomyces chengmaiensis TaxID=3040919 RepID=A0ABT6HWD8_9ACTN|nr:MULTISPECIES: thiocillin family RiPP [Streptomyces]MDH2392164.1 thiocillin family RiPP [Streptomyces chengmaiensis]WRQ81686.1 thiocillin family RiPP [Streptomyces sp. MUM 178J]